jgi:putative transposase
MSKERWTHANTCVYNIGYHLIWCPKYRRKVLQAHIADRLKELLNHKAEELDIKIAICEVMPDHVHVFVKCRPTASPHWIVQQLKGYTSRIMRQEFEPLRTRLPTLWTRSYYCESCGHISEDVVKKYIEDQKRN